MKRSLVAAMDGLNSSLELINNISEIYNYVDNTTLASNESLATTIKEESDLDHKWYEIIRYIYIVVLPIIIIFGSTGNILTIIVMQRSSLKDVSTCFYVSILALADTGESIKLLI